MAVQTSKPAARGENIADPTRAGRPAPQTYRSPIMPKGSPAGAAGGYGRNQYAGAASVSVKDSAGVSDFSAGPDDPVLAGLQQQGFGDHSGGEGPAADLERKISTDGYPAAHGMRNRSDPAAAVRVPGSLGDNEAEPVRQPPRGQGQM